MTNPALVSALLWLLPALGLTGCSDDPATGKTGTVDASSDASSEGDVSDATGPEVPSPQPGDCGEGTFELEHQATGPECLPIPDTCPEDSVDCDCLRQWEGFAQACLGVLNQLQLANSGRLSTDPRVASPSNYLG